MTPSIRRRLLVWLLGSATLAVAAGAVSTYLVARKQANELADYQLQQMALSFRDHALASGLIPHEDEDGPGLEVLVQIWNQEGVRLYLSHPRSGIPDRAQLGFADVASRQGRWRVYSVQVRDHVIQVAQPYSVRNRIAASVALRTAWPLAAVLPLLGLLIWFTVGRGLSPLERLARDVRRRSPDALDALPQLGLPQEVQPLVQSLNDLLQRLERALQTQRAFVADAAHELRTPLTALRLQAQVAERATDRAERSEALGMLKQGVERASHVVQQLLTLAREEDPPASAPARVQLDELARDVVAQYMPLAHRRGIDLGLAQAEPVAAAGVGAALRTLLSNLIDNAVRYTPAQGRVDVAAFRDGAQAALEVTDSGPGIPPEERTRVFDRFYRRAGEASDGSGLGLAIVKQIVTRHGGTIALEDAGGAGGLKVAVRLPLAPAP
ncbi:MAG TPA: ATP-binding protein [Burkholderiales bacterium]|nr:ATP-binding protein [Burkholderiales bacterium]